LTKEELARHKQEGPWEFFPGKEILQGFPGILARDPGKDFPEKRRCRELRRCLMQGRSFTKVHFFCLRVFFEIDFFFPRVISKSIFSSHE
jgi:hypothetical protein